ncbi:hypothetical protein [Lentzea cavernae]|uniref:Uncharacterized protein n=1 Tax=Lentzea cavernae TaxID=2020703 RepID=A0ABQ3MSH2_9PSEU|nr:hypothetical protein [Lentzea cavernae]GHH57830.1 hypothetical protein GCM10017774_78190 [Lentzea cavernae]
MTDQHPVVQRPSVGRIVHYVSHGSPIREDGTQVFPSECRAAIVSEAGAWIAVATIEAESFSRSEGRPIRHVEQWFYDDAVTLTVLHPTGSSRHACKHDETNHASGTWHWPERVS